MSGTNTRRTWLLVAALAALVCAPSAGAATVDLGPGRDPGVAVDPQGTAYVSWNGTEGGSTTLHFCRLPRGAPTCTAGGPIPASGTSLLRPFVVVDGTNVTVLSYRYGEGVEGFSAVYLFRSSNGGTSFAPGVQVGTQAFYSAATGPGLGTSLASSAEGGGLHYQRVPTDGSPKVTARASLSESHGQHGAVGLIDGATPIVVSSTASDDLQFRRHTGVGDVNDAATWTASQPLGRGAYNNLAGGPDGLYLMTALGGQLELRKYTGTGFTPPAPIPGVTGDTPQAHLTQDPAGRLHAVWPSFGGSFHTLELARSDGGTTFRRQTIADEPGPIRRPRAAVAADHIGVAVWELATSGTQIRLAPIVPAADAPPAHTAPVDTAPPDTIITEGPADGGTVSSPPRFAFTSTEAGSRFECSLKPAQLDLRDGPSWAPCSSPFAPAPRGFAYMTFRVRAIDGAGNVDPTPAARSYINDPVAYGNMRVRGIDVFQVVQPLPGAEMYGYQASNQNVSRGFPLLCGGGTPTAWRRQRFGGGFGEATLGPCTPTGEKQRVAYDGVALDTSKPATAIVYVDMQDAAASDPAQPLEVTLIARFANGRRVGPELVQRITNPEVSTTPWVTRVERARARLFGVHFQFAPSWLGTIPITLTATVRFAPGTRSWNEAECVGDVCLADNTFALTGIPKFAAGQLMITPLLLRSQATQVAGTTFPNPEAVLDAARPLVPGGDRIVLRGYATSLDISTQAALNAQADPATPGGFLCNSQAFAPPTTQVNATRSCRTAAVAAVVDQWVTDNPPRFEGGDGRVIRAYDAVMGVHNYVIPTATGSGAEPGWQWGGTVRDVSRDAVGTVPRFTVTCCTRPLTAVTHELMHALTAPHAGAGDTSCTGNGEAWPPDNTGAMQGWKFDRRLPGDEDVPAPSDDPVIPFFDLMSYCGATSDTGEADTLGSSGDTWISARNWNRVAAEMTGLRQRLGLPLRRRPRARVRAAADTAAFAVGIVGSQDGRITRVVPADESDAVRAPEPSSPVRVRALGPGGAVLGEVGVVVTRSSEGGADAQGTFVAPLPAGTAAVELVRDGRVLDRRARGAAPRVSLQAPRAGIRVRERGSLLVTWSASDADSGAAELSATVDYSADGGQSWRTVHQGPSAGSTTIRGNTLAATTRARVRVSVSDGFSETSVRSGRFRADGRRPDIRIASPHAGAQLLAGTPVPLEAVTSDGAGRPLGNRAIAWFAGRRSLGRGAQLTARLPAGRITLRAVARDRAGSRTVTRSLRVAAVPLRLTSLQAPRSVPARARTVTVRIAASRAATLRASGRRVRVGTRSRRVVLRLPPRPARGPVRARFTLTARSGGGRVSAFAEVFRGRP